MIASPIKAIACPTSFFSFSGGIKCRKTECKNVFPDLLISCLFTMQVQFITQIIKFKSYFFLEANKVNTYHQYKQRKLRAFAKNTRNRLLRSSYSFSFVSLIIIRKTLSPRILVFR